uniref:Serine/threonine-protein phosphatase n=1 Tax=Romanomermis culicivorax TaxID=13658 RepID=A0A915HTM0_ROMCU
MVGETGWSGKRDGREKGMVGEIAHNQYLLAEHLRAYSVSIFAEQRAEHGQFGDVLEILDSMKWPSEQKYLFLGDYVDRGEQSLELICLIFYLKIKYPRNFFILRGNHEAAEINATHGFKDDCLLRYDLTVWNLFQEGFKALPLAALVGSKIFCLHGGLSPYLTTLDDIRRLPRPLEVPESGLVCDLI